MNQVRPTLPNRLSALEFEIERSIRYCNHRIAFFQSMSITSHIFTVGTSSAAFILLNKTILAHFLIALAAIFSVLSFYLSVTEKSLHYKMKRTKFLELKIKIQSTKKNVSETQRNKWYRTWEKNEEDGIVPLTCLRIICHNEVCFDWKINNNYPLTRWEEYVGAYIPIVKYRLKESRI